MGVYPCKGCLVLPVCEELCNKLESTAMLHSFFYFHDINYCPDCGSFGLFCKKEKTFLYNQKWNCPTCGHIFYSNDNNQRNYDKFQVVRSNHVERKDKLKV